MSVNDKYDILEWIRFAQMDYDAAENMAILHRPIPIEIVCYHCQQAVEKIFKAYILAHGDSLVKIHDLLLLQKQCARHDKSFDEFIGVCAALTSYSVITRYPSSAQISFSDMEYALQGAKKTIKFTKARLSELGYKTKTQRKKKEDLK